MGAKSWPRMMREFEQIERLQDSFKHPAALVE
jgi:hypothetical protein